MYWIQAFFNGTSVGPIAVNIRSSGPYKGAAANFVIRAINEATAYGKGIKNCESCATITMNSTGIYDSGFPGISQSGYISFSPDDINVLSAKVIMPEAGGATK
ncbi:hypothetical protein [Citrobacter meridianamericanus]|uniref:Uncharacterized protein n=1 Tax=Citrobacter meridianamericanus TaxID=2894201 RepID=A0ABT1BG32_9ENTR|nr:hypothetical protein [Citrobacter meridianamericanus]MCO5784401.1 hypothetical protein [Citrobacter meridianamericanus]